jgi:hypothetical protein
MSYEHGTRSRVDAYCYVFEIHGKGLCDLFIRVWLIYSPVLILIMGFKDPAKYSKKRKHTSEDDAKISAPFEVEDLEMLSDEEDRESATSDDGHVDEFPEIDTGSEGASDSLEETDDDDDLDEDENEDNDSDSDDLHIFPKAKTIISDITGQEKRVYPDIEPEYESDSSTEDVRPILMLFQRPYQL